MLRIYKKVTLNMKFKIIRYYLGPWLIGGCCQMGWNIFYVQTGVDRRLSLNAMTIGDRLKWYQRLRETYTSSLRMKNQSKLDPNQGP